MGDDFVRHRQPWTMDETAKLRRLAAKGETLKGVAKALRRSEESIQARAKELGLTISKMR